ncbi:MAG TPA: ATP-binding cassette domain-containing protein [Candidatus Corynebacterium avicola]|uniref:ATP-binding cassette domain-containing protein n=1 Tax=Candidatus Corynebacterium avicola TaxID=2838527 RepID=A0A9D1UL14_9CORY|nr:ATP-binding cassette domain-containing protein [Candidatus Corynebacterium avicola]
MSAAQPSALHAHDLVKTYGDQRALDGFTLTVAPGTIHGLLGPNGAGKSTAVGVLSTLTRHDGGAAQVSGIDVTDGTAVRGRIGLVGQDAAVDEILSGRQNLVMFARLLSLSRKDATRRATELLDQFALTEAADRPVSGYSGGMRRRLDIAVSLIRNPDVLFLDEPTTGLDPQGRLDVWDAITSAASEGTTVLLTTQYLEEADRLADRISIMKEGRVIAEGTPAELKGRLGGDRIELTFAPEFAQCDIVAALDVTENALTVTPEGTSVGVPASRGAADLTDIVRALDAASLPPSDIALRRPTLDEVFLAVTSEPHRTEQEAA